MADFDTSLYRVQPKSLSDFDNEAYATQNNRLALMLQQEQVNNAPVRSDMLRLQLQGQQLGNQQLQQKMGILAPILQRFAGGQQQAATAAPPGASISPAVAQAHATQLQSLAAVDNPQDALKWAQSGLAAGVFDKAHYQDGVAKLAQAASDPAAFAQWKQQTAQAMQQGQALIQQQGAQPALAAGGGLPSNFPLSFNDVTALKLAGGPDLSADFKTALEGVSRGPGSEVTDVNGNRRTIPVLDKGQQLDPATGVVSNLPGYVASSAQAAGATAGATTSATEAAKAPYTPVTTYRNGQQGQVMLSDLLKGPQAASAAPAIAAFQGSGPLAGASPQVQATIMQDMQRNGVRQGALALAQPGGGIAQSTFDRTQPAGPGAALTAAPAAPVAGFNPTGPSAAEKAAQDAAAAALKDQATADVKLKTQPEIESQTEQSKGAAASGQKYQADLHDQVAQEYQLIARNKALLPLLKQFPTGGFGADERSKIGNEIANTQTLPADLREKLGAWVAGGDPATGRVIANQLAAAGISNLLQTLDKEGKPNRAEFVQLNKAAEGLDSGTSSLEGVFAQQQRVYDSHFGEQQALVKSIKAGTYNPKTWQGDYSASRNSALTPPTAASAPAATATPAAPVKIASDADYNKLPSGSEFIAPDGSHRKKP